VLVYDCGILRRGRVLSMMHECERTCSTRIVMHGIELWQRLLSLGLGTEPCNH
jgi:hypothetical protein